MNSGQEAYMLAKNGKHGHLPRQNCFGSLYFCNPVLPCDVQDTSKAHWTPRTAFLQEGEDDEDITPMDTTREHLLDMLVQITRVRVRQTNLQVRSFRTSVLSNFENRLLPNDLIIVRNHGDDDETNKDGFGGVEVHLGVVEGQQGRASPVRGPIQINFESDSESKSSLL